MSCWVAIICLMTHHVQGKNAINWKNVIFLHIHSRNSASLLSVGSQAGTRHNMHCCRLHNLIYLGIYNLWLCAWSWEIQRYLLRQPLGWMMDFRFLSFMWGIQNKIQQWGRAKSVIFHHHNIIYDMRSIILQHTAVWHLPAAQLFSRSPIDEPQTNQKARHFSFLILLFFSFSLRFLWPATTTLLCHLPHTSQSPERETSPRGNLLLLSTNNLLLLLLLSFCPTSSAHPTNVLQEDQPPPPPQPSVRHTHYSRSFATWCCPARRC